MVYPVIFYVRKLVVLGYLDVRKDVRERLT